MFKNITFLQSTCLNESCSWVTLAVTQGCAGTWMSRSPKHLVPTPFQIKTHRGTKQLYVTYAHPLPSTAASHLPQNDLLGVYVTAKGEDKSQVGAGPAISVCPMTHTPTQLYGSETEIMTSAWKLSAR